MTVLNFQPRLEKSSWDPGFDHNTVRDSGNVNGIRDLTAAQETRFAKTTRLGKRAILGRAMTEFRDAGFSAGSGPPFSNPILKDHTRNHAWRFRDTGLGNSVILGRAWTEVRDAGFSTGSGPPFPDPISKNHARSQAWRSLERRKHSSRDLR